MSTSENTTSASAPEASDATDALTAPASSGDVYAGALGPIERAFDLAPIKYGLPNRLRLAYTHAALGVLAAAAALELDDDAQPDAEYLRRVATDVAIKGAREIEAAGRGLR